MKPKRLLTALAALAIVAAAALAQGVTVTVNPVQRVLPPQVGLYVSNPGRFFNVTLMNSSPTRQTVYLAMVLEQVNPVGVRVVTPPDLQPPKAITVEPNSTKMLNAVELKDQFAHIPIGQIQAPDGLFDNIASGSFGLLPEGQYKVNLVAYRYGAGGGAQAVSSAMGGTAMFTVCYKAQPPRFLTPMAGVPAAFGNTAALSKTMQGSKKTAVSNKLAKADAREQKLKLRKATDNYAISGTPPLNSNVAMVDRLNPQFTWTEPVVTCGSNLARYTYSLRIVQLLPGQNADDAMHRNPVVYQADRLKAAMCIVPKQVIDKMDPTAQYVAQVTATPTNSATAYVQIENEGKSNMLLLGMGGQAPEPDLAENTPAEEDNGDNDDKGGDKEDDGDKKDKEDPGILYSFKQPKITSPSFGKGSHSYDAERNIYVAWDAATYSGGSGEEAEKQEFSYSVSLYKADKNKKLEDIIKGSAIATNEVEPGAALSSNFQWVDISAKVKVGDSLLVCVLPTCTTSPKEVKFEGDTASVGFKITEGAAKDFANCGGTPVENKTPTEKKAADLKGQTVDIGQYKLLIDEIGGDADKGFKGKGRIEWKPAGATVMVCVQFDDLKINTDDRVFYGIAKSYAEPDGPSNSEIVDMLLEDLGVDDFVDSWGMPSYADKAMDKAMGMGKDELKKLADKYDLSQYYKYVAKGKDIYSSLKNGRVERAYMPLILPKEYNPSPVNVQIISMKFGPTAATMNIMGETTLPDNGNITKQDLLVFGSPSMCMEQGKMLPSNGTLSLLSDITMVDKRTSYEITFRSPSTLVSPKDGCFVTWENDTIRLLTADMKMNIPGLKKDMNGKATDQKPELTMRASIGSWDDWIVEDLSIDPFQVEDMPGFTFSAKDVVLDYSAKRNAAGFPDKFPKGYDKDELGLAKDTEWKGLFIKTISLKLPKMLECGSTSDKRFETQLENIYIDKSGFTMSAAADNVFKATTGSMGGWGFSLDKISLNVVQSNFNNCTFGGFIKTPLIDTDVMYSCQIRKHVDTKKDADGQLAYIFKTYQMEDANFDFMLAKATFNKNLTYFLLEAEPDEKGEMNTKAELCMGGDMKIGGTDWLNEKLAALPMKPEIPSIHFSSMRIANCKKWESKYEKDLQNGKDNADILYKIYEAKEMDIEGKLYFHLGTWSLATGGSSSSGKDKAQNIYGNTENLWAANHGPAASPAQPVEFKKNGYLVDAKIGSFTFGIKEFKPSLDKDGNDYKLAVGIVGGIKLVSGIDLTADCGFHIESALKNAAKIISDPSKISSLGFEYKETKFDSLTIDCSFAGVSIEGTLEAKSKSASDPSSGYGGDLSIKLPGDIFNLKGAGGYYTYDDGKEDFSYGFFQLSVGGRALNFGAVSVTSLMGGFYFNCKNDGDLKEVKVSNVKPQNGLIGVVAGIELASGDPKVMKGSFDMTVVYDRKNDRLSRFLMNGGVNAGDGIITADASLLYYHDDTDEFISLNITCETGIGEKQSGGNNNNEGSQADVDSNLKQLNGDYEGVLPIPKGDASALSENKESDTSKTKKSGGSGLAVGKSTLSLEIKVTMKEKGKKKTKWHVWLGNPYGERCEVILLRYKGRLIKVDFGANYYLCFGNELPGTGNLPPLPDKVKNFLYGNSSKNTKMDVADNKQKQTDLNSLKQHGGIMAGAQAWGLLDVDLKLFYAKLDAIAGFDVLLANNFTCANASGSSKMGSWRLKGQLYAYLAAVMGLRIDLGFWKKDFDFFDAAIGGILNFEGFGPSYVGGKARVKLNMFGGLVKLNKSFSFSYGEKCEAVYGNALDNFTLIENCSIGDTTIVNKKPTGWEKSNAIYPELLEKPVVTTSSNMDSKIQVVDPNDINNNFDGNMSKADLASQVFVFHIDNDAKLGDYGSNCKDYVFELRKHKVSGSTPQLNNYTTIKLKAEVDRGTPTKIKLAMFDLLPDSYYSISIQGRAFQQVNGVYQNPKDARNNNKPYVWTQRRTYYFRTGEAEKFDPNSTDLQKYVALAYPSYDGKLKNEGHFKQKQGSATVSARRMDMKKPIIALSEDIDKQGMFKKSGGKLVWSTYKTTDGGKTYRKLSQSANKYVRDRANTCTMMPTNNLSVADGQMLLRLDYIVTTNTTTKVNTYKTQKTTSKGLKTNVDGRIQTIDGVAIQQNTGVKTVTTKNITVSDTVNLVYLEIDRVDNYAGDDMATNLVNGKYDQWVGYDRGLIGVRIASYNVGINPLKNYPSSYGGPAREMCQVINAAKESMTNPFSYVGLLSNYAFVSGYEFNNTYGQFDKSSALPAMRATNPMSLKYTVGDRYHYGHLIKPITNSTTNIEQGLYDVQDLVFKRTGKGVGNYPLPQTGCDFKYGNNGRSPLILEPCVKWYMGEKRLPIYYAYVDLVRTFYNMTQTLDGVLKQEGSSLHNYIFGGKPSVDSKEATHKLIKYFSGFGHETRTVTAKTSSYYSNVNMSFEFKRLQIALLHGTGWPNKCYMHDAHLQHFNGDLSRKKTTRAMYEIIPFISKPILGWGFEMYPFTSNNYGYVPSKTYFNAEEAMKKFGSMTFDIYRVDRYNWKDKKYEATSVAKKTAYGLDWRKY